MAHPENVQRGEATVVNVPLQMARRPGQFRLNRANRTARVAA